MERGDRVILHCDCNGFYASVETLLRPELKTVPMAVSGDPKSRHGIILAKNEIAKKYGVQTAETIWQARKKCPDLILVPPHREQYTKWSGIINEIYRDFTDLVEPFGIDESWLDVTGTTHLFGDGKTIADKLRAKVKAETGLTISVGVSFCKIFAKLGSDYKKPDATTVISRENMKQLVWPMDCSALLFVGKASKIALGSLGIKTIGDIANYNRQALLSFLGKQGGLLHDYANGIDSSPVSSAYQSSTVKSVGNGMTFSRDLVGKADVKLGIAALCDSVAGRMRAQGVVCTTVQVHIRDTGFKTISRQRKLTAPTDLAKDLEKAALDLVEKNWSASTPIRALTVTALGITPKDEQFVQLILEQPEDSKKRLRRQNLERTIDDIRKKYGRGAIKSSAVLKNDIGLSEDSGDEQDPDDKNHDL